jgi:hypothetical protein
MKFMSRSLSLVLVCLCTAAAFANVAPPARDQVRAELSSYFKNIEKNSPTVLGGLAKSPEAMKAIQDRIATMSDEEAAAFQKMLAETPDWKLAPEAFAGAFPPEMLEQIKRVGVDYTQQVPKGEKMRAEVRTLVEVLKQVPDAKLLELGIDRRMIASLDTTFEQMTPLQVAMLQRQAGDTTSWREKSALAIHTLPPALRRGAAALSAHGLLTESDVAELTQFRDELVSLLGRVDSLPAAARAKLRVENLVAKADQLRVAPPDVLFMVRHNLTPQMLDSLRANVAFLERISSFSDKEKNDLERFRSDLRKTLQQVNQDQGDSGLDATLSQLGPEHLFLFQKQMATYGEWQTALPAVYQTMSSAELPDRLRAIEGPSADPAAVAGLDAFRAQALAWVDAVAGEVGEPELVARARRTIETAPLNRLELIRMTAERMADASTKAKLSMVLMHEINFGCSVSVTAVPEVCFPEICVGGCETILGVEVCVPRVCTPAGCTPAVTVTANFDVVCNPIEDALETIEHSITGIANGIVNTMNASIQTAISTVQNTINNAISAVNDVISDTIAEITDTIDEVWTFLQALPADAWNAIKTALNLLLDIEVRNGVTLRQLMANGAESGMNAMVTMLGMAGDWWTAVSTFTLPAIPCPPAGFHTPFGDVGDGAAAANYGRYRLVIDGIIGMIPDTETSLAIKIPAQVLYMAFDFLGMCLEQAAADADQAQGTSRHNLVMQNFTDMQAFVGAQISGLAAASGTQTNTIMALIGTQSSTIRSSIVSHSAVIQSLTTTEAGEIQNLIDAKSSSIQSLIQNESDATQNDIAEFQDLNVRLTIERVLQAGINSEIGHLQVRAPWGHLALVGEIVNETIAAMTQAGETVNQARRYYDMGIALMAAGKDKEAFKQFALAYRETTK